MPVFDFNQEKKDAVKAEKTYELIYTDEHFADAEHPIMLLEDRDKKMVHHSSGMFMAPVTGTAFVYEKDEEKSNHW